MQLKNKFIIPAIIFFIVALSLFGFYLFKTKTDALKMQIIEKELLIEQKESAVVELSDEIDSLEGEVGQLNIELGQKDSNISNLEEELADTKGSLGSKIQQLSCEGVWRNGKCTGKPLALLSPTGGETMCIGDEFNIEWQSGQLTFVKPVQIAIIGNDIKFVIGNYPVSFNETGESNYGLIQWKAGSYEYEKSSWNIPSNGNLLKQGSAYQIEITSVTEYMGTDEIVQNVRDISKPFQLIDCRG